MYFKSLLATIAVLSLTSPILAEEVVTVTNTHYVCPCITGSRGGKEWSTHLQSPTGRPLRSSTYSSLPHYANSTSTTAISTTRLTSSSLTTTLLSSSLTTTSSIVSSTTVTSATTVTSSSASTTATTTTTGTATTTTAPQSSVSITVTIQSIAPVPKAKRALSYVAFVQDSVVAYVTSDQGSAATFVLGSDGVLKTNGVYPVGTNIYTGTQNVQITVSNPTDLWVADSTGKLSYGGSSNFCVDTSNNFLYVVLTGGAPASCSPAVLTAQSASIPIGVTTSTTTTTAPSAASTLQNGGFESADDNSAPWYDLPSQIAYGGRFINDLANASFPASEGNRFGEAYYPNYNSLYGIAQDFNFVSGQTYTISIDAMKPGSAASDIPASVFIGVDKGAPGSPSTFNPVFLKNVYPVPGATWATTTVTFTGQDYTRLFLSFTALNGGEAPNYVPTSLLVDNVKVTLG